MSQNCVMKQLIHNAASYLPRLQSQDHCQAFIIPSPQMNHCTVVLTSSFHCCVDSHRALSSYKSVHLMRLTGHLGSFLVVFSPCQKSSAALWLCYRQNSSHSVDLELLHNHGACLTHPPKLSLVSSHGGLTSSQ